MSNVTFDSSYSEEEYLSAIQRDFTNRAPVYNEGFSGEHHRDFLSKLLSLYPPRYPLLDIACGTGLLATTLSNRGQGVTGVDLTPAMLSEARRACPDATYVQGRAEALPLADATFASAYICAALVYFTDIPAALREAHRVLRPGGFLAYQAVSSESYIAGIALERALVDVLGNVRGREVFECPHGITNTRDDNVRLMESAGFVDVTAEMITLDHVLAIDGAEKWWTKLGSGNAMTARVKLLPEGDLEMVREKYIAFLEERRNAEGLVEDKIESWYVKGTKPM